MRRAEITGMKASGRQRVWTINGDFVSLQPTGVARYAREVTVALDSLLAAKHPLTVGLELNILAPRSPTDLPLTAIPVKILAEFSRPRLPQFWVQVQLPRYVTGGLLSFCNLAPIWTRRHIVCIHDLHTRVMPESYGLGFRWAHRMILPLVGRRARWITTVSQLSRDHLIAFGIAPAEKIAITYNGSDHALRWNAGKASLTLCERPYVVALGQRQRYKNTELIWRIANSLDQLGVDIYVAGDLDAESLGTFGPSIPSNVRLFGRVSDNDLAGLFKHALALLFPSRIEGFGLPAVEAMAQGCPVIASTSPCLPEICGDAAIYAGPDDGDAWVSAVQRLHSDPTLRTAMAERGHARAQRYRWRDIAEIYLQLMACVDGCNQENASQ
jgi:glycosyltransferase involved in cell wall biosynthesis